LTQYQGSKGHSATSDDATALDLKMGYYTIRLGPIASKMCTIIFPWGKFSYKRLPMGFGGSANIFQAQIMDLMASLEFV
jgi:hypothetical protein